MRLPLILCTIPPFAACVEREMNSATIVFSMTPEQRDAYTAAAVARDLPQALVTATSAKPPPRGRSGCWRWAATPPLASSTNWAGCGT